MNGGNGGMGEWGGKEVLGWNSARGAPTHIVPAPAKGKMKDNMGDEVYEDGIGAK